MNAKTTVDGKTVNELFNEKMEDAWSDLDISDKRRQYFELIRAKAALTDGYDFLPTETFNTSPSNSTPIADDSVVMKSGNRYGLLKEKQIAEKLEKLSGNKGIVDGVDNFMKDAVAKIDDKSGLINKVYTAMNSDEYQSS